MTSLKPAVGTNGSYQYLDARAASQPDRTDRERFWRSLGKRIRKGARIGGYA